MHGPVLSFLVAKETQSSLDGLLTISATTWVSV